MMPLNSQTQSDVFILRKLAILWLSGLYPNSFRGISYDWTIASSRAGPPQSSIQYLLSHFPVSCRLHNFIKQLLTSSSSSSSHVYPTPYPSFNNVFHKAVSTQNVTYQVSHPFIYFVQEIPLLIALYGAKTSTFRAVDQKHLESFEMWCWRRMKKIS